MPCEQFEHIKEIRQTYHDDSEQSKENQMNMIEMLAEDLNKTDTHFIFELIQNAEDNRYVEPLPYISFRLTKMDPTSTEGSDGALIVENNEIGFKHDNVRAICAAGRSTKKKAQKYIGEKGIGFKSVFRITGSPHIFSNGYHFCLPESDDGTGLGYIVPRWVDRLPEGLNPSATHIILPLTKPDFGYDQIEKMLRDIQPEVILFLSTLKQIRIKTDTGIDFTILKDNERQPEVSIDVKGNKVGNYQGDDFLVCTKKFDKPAHINHEKRKRVEDREVSIAFPLDGNSTAKEKIFAYLPVRDDTGLPFLINADFILTSSRDDIHENVPWNCWLMECVADLVVEEFLPLLKERNRLNIGFLEALASELNNLSGDENDLFYPIFSRLREAFMSEELLPANDETFVSAQNAKLDDSEGLIELLDPNQLGLLFKRSDITKWLLSDITARRTPNLWQYLRDELKIDEVDPEMFARRIDISFLKQQSDSWFINFYKFLSVGARPPRSLWNSPSSILRSKPILRLQDNSLVNPNETNVYLSKGADSETTSRLIKSEVSQNEDAHKFLNKELGLPEWDLVAEVIDDILPKYCNNQLVSPKAEYDRDFVKIVNAYKTNSEKKKNQLREVLLTTPFIFAKDSGLGRQIYLKPNQLRFGSNDNLWKNNANGHYSRVSVSKQIFFFLRTLDIPQWDIVDEVIETILPKYKQEPPTVSITEHMNDFKEIIFAYETSEQRENIQLKTKLQATHFLLAESPDGDFPIYLKPDHLYFPTDPLRIYFESHSLVSWIEIWNDNNENLAELWSYFVDDSLDGPPMAGAFVNLDKYPEAARALFLDLGVTDLVRIQRKKEDSYGNVAVVSQYGNHKRGLKGFDPHIRVDGLEYALDNSTVEKSAFIWNRIVIRNADCIKGTIEESTRQDYWRSSPENVVSDSFGSLLMDKAWLPDSDGNMHKPSEITLEDLHEEFIRDERLANQLGMKKDAVAELAEEIGVSVEIIEKIRQNPEEYEEFQAWKAEKKAREQNPDVPSTLPGSSSNVDEMNGNSTPAGSEGPETDRGNTDSVDDGPILHSPPRPNVTKRGPQGGSQGHTSHRKPSGRNGGHGGGGGPGEEHEDLKNNIAQNPSQLGEGLKLIQKEYTFKSSNDRVDILLIDSSGRPVPVEVKPHIPSGSNCEVLQALKYKHLAADDYNIPCKEVRCVLAAPEIPNDVKKKCRQLGIEPFIPPTANG